MASWEYAELRVWDGWLGDKDVKTEFQIMGHPVDRVRMRWSDFLVVAGEEGWEVATVAQTRRRLRVYTMKRLTSEGD